MVAMGRVAEGEYDRAGNVRSAGLLFRMQNFPGVARGEAPVLGGNSLEILYDMGWSDKIDDLVKRGIVLVPLRLPQGSSVVQA